jgi:hypothetical protein
MATNRSSFAKLERDRNKSAKAAAKRERRQGKAEKRQPEEPIEIPGEPGEELTAAELLTLVEQVHRQLDNKEITFEEFEERKTELLQRLPVD